MHPRLIFFITSILFLFGLFLGSLDGGFFFGLMTILILIHIGILRQKILITTLSLVTLCLGGWMGYVSFESHIGRQEILDPYIFSQKKYSFMGEIGEKISKKGIYQKYSLKLLSVRSDLNSPEKYLGDTPISIIITVPENLTLQRGESISWQGKIEALGSPGSGYERSGWIRGRYAQAWVPVFRRENQGTLPRSSGTNTVGVFFLHFDIFDTFDKIRVVCLDRIAEIYPGDVAGLLTGLIIGDTSLLSDKTIEEFRLTGLSHIIAVSGSNITFLLLLTEKILRYFRLRKWYRIIIISTIILSFMILAQMSIPVIRATIMGLILYIGFASRTRFESMILLLMVVIGFSIYEPLSTPYDASLMLSCIATASILIATHFSHGRFLWLGRIPLLRESLIMSVAASIGTTPFLLATFGYIPLYGILTNILIEPFIGWSMSIGILSLILSLVHPLLTHLIGWIVYLGINSILGIASFMSKIDPGLQAPSDLSSFFDIFFGWSLFIFVGLVFRFLQSRIQ